MTNPFLNDREGRLRAFWRLLLLYVLYSNGAVLLAGGFGLAFLAASEGMNLAGEPANSSLFQPMNSIVASFVAGVASVWLAGRLFDRRPFSSFGLRVDRVWWLDFCFGLVLGAVLMTAIFLVELAAGWVTVTGTFEVANNGSPFALAILFPLVAFSLVGFYEELLSRGYQLQNMAEGLNFPALGPRAAILLAWVLSSAVFGLLHFANPNASALSTLNITFAGLLLGTGYVLTGQLAIPIGLHITWNFFQGNVFGFPVSGIRPLNATFVSVEQGGPPLLTGGAFGPEAGLLVPAAILVGSLLIWLWVRARSGEGGLETSIAESPRARTEGTGAPGKG